MKNGLHFLCLLLLFSWTDVMTQPTNNNQHTIDLTSPPKKPALFEENFISTSLYERDIAISPDGDEIFYTTMIPLSNFQTLVHIKKVNGRWTMPEIVSFSGKYSDLEPAFSIDGKKLFFCSNRPVEGDKIKDFDIWCVDKTNGKWGEPKNLGSPVNSAADEFYPSVASNGNLYFTAQYKGGVGREDIYVSKWENGSYQPASPLDTMVNSAVFEFNAYISPDEKFIIFSSQGRKDEKGRGDLYISVKNEHNGWKLAKNLSILNSDRLDYCPFVSFDKKILFFTSESHELKKAFATPINYDDIKNIVRQTKNGTGNIYWIDFNSLKEFFE
jgi:Tol biopolymer transport system component